MQHCLLNVRAFERGRTPASQDSKKRDSSSGVCGGLEAAMDQVHLVPARGQEEEIVTLEKVDCLQESKRVVHQRSWILASQGVLELHGFFGESLCSFFPREAELLPRGVSRADSHASGHFTIRINKTNRCKETMCLALPNKKGPLRGSASVRRFFCGFKISISLCSVRSRARTVCRQIRQRWMHLS